MTWIKKKRDLLLFVMILASATLACGLLDLGNSGGPPSDATVVNLVANTSLQRWLEEATVAFNDSETETAAGNPVYVTAVYRESGQAVTDFASGTAVADIWLPEEQVWANVLADQGIADFQGNCESVAQSPLVIAMWRDVAESLGWPGLPLGWLDAGSLAADPSAWAYYSGGGLGDTFRLGHTHPGLSGSGASTLLSIVQSAESKVEAVTVADIQKPIVQASVGAFEGGVAWFSTDTTTLGATMSERGVSYLGAGIMYESTVLQHGNGNLVPIYPLEGTFMATHPACINSSSNGEIQEAAQLFRSYLTGTAGQETAVRHGLRPVLDGITIGAPFTAENGVDLTQPTNIFQAPSVATIYAVQELWQSARKDVNLVMLLDTSGSMRGDKMENMLVAAADFVGQMGDDDAITLIAFSTTPEIIIENTQIGPNRAKVVNAITGLRAAGDTTLFDAIGLGAEVIGRTSSPDKTNALVVLTDGQDTASFQYSFDETLINAATANSTTIFTIAYGSDADEDTLQDLATAANGNYFLGDEASIATIYEEMSAAFGGSVGVGR